MITSPTLLVDENRCRANISRMARKANRHDLDFKPHFKTHQSADIGEWFRDEGVNGITVSSVKMAAYFAQHEWDDITIAFPVNVREIRQINNLAKNVDLTLLISESSSLDTLNELLETHVHVFVEIDTGSNRTGFKAGNRKEIGRLIEKLNKWQHTTFKGFYSHPGHSYASRSKEDILKVHADVMRQFSELKTEFNSQQDEFSVCVGDTPCCSVADDFNPIDQISPGNFVFYDVMQTRIGSCALEDIAVALACPIVAKYPSRNEIIVHGGAIHLSKEMIQENSFAHFGLPVILDKNSWKEPIKNGYVKSISQEHGVIKCPTEILNTLKIGDLVGILPVHSCLTADLMMGYQTVDNKHLNHIRIN